MWGLFGPLQSGGGLRYGREYVVLQAAYLTSGTDDHSIGSYACSS